jgi:hypothetical protein
MFRSPLPTAIEGSLATTSCGLVDKRSIRQRPSNFFLSANILVGTFDAFGGIRELL